MTAKRKELDRLNGIYKQILDKNNVDLIKGRGRLLDNHTVEVNGQKYTAKYILIASGGHAIAPPIPGVDLTVNSDEVLDLGYRPKKMAIVGAGYIALEQASIFNAFGAETHLYYRGGALTGFDRECKDFLLE